MIGRYNPNDIWNSYPTLALGLTSLHLTPSTGVIRHPAKSLEPLPNGIRPAITATQYQSVDFINVTAARLLSHCNGRRTVEQIVRLVAPEGELTAPQKREDILAFFTGS